MNVAAVGAARLGEAAGGVDPMAITGEDLAKVFIAVVIGGLLGLERELQEKAAGFRTMILICVGSALFTMLSMDLGGSNDPARIAAAIVTGIGFLGAGAIIQSGGHVRGLTTAATVWLAAALGMAIGGGFYGLSAVTTAAALIVLWVLGSFERVLSRRRDRRTYRITLRLAPAPGNAAATPGAGLGARAHPGAGTGAGAGAHPSIKHVHTMAREAGLRELEELTHKPAPGTLTLTLRLIGTESQQHDFTQRLLQNNEVESFDLDAGQDMPQPQPGAGMAGREPQAMDSAKNVSSD